MTQEKGAVSGSGFSRSVGIPFIVVEANNAFAKNDYELLMVVGGELIPVGLKERYALVQLFIELRHVVHSPFRQKAQHTTRPQKTTVLRAHFVL